MARKTLTAVITVIGIIAILAAMLTGCNKTPEENFQERLANADIVKSDGAEMLQEKAVELLKENGITVEQSYVTADFLDGIPYITIITLVTDEGGQKALKSYSVKTDYNGPIASAFDFNSDEISVYGDMLYIDYYFEYGNYSLQGEEIVVTE